MSVWIRHEPENFDGYSKEQFLGHGNPNQYTGHRNQLHIQLEKLDLDADRLHDLGRSRFAPRDRDLDRERDPPPPLGLRLRYPSRLPKPEKSRSPRSSSAPSPNISRQRRRF